MTIEESLLKKPQVGDTVGRDDFLRLALIGLAYFAANKIALLFPDAERVLAAVWPAAGVGLAALLLSPRKSWLRVLTVIFIAGNIANLVSGRPFVNSLCFMTANCLESYGSAWLITRWCGESVKFNRIREISALACAATLVNAVTTTVSSTFASVVGLGAFKSFWLTWWVSDGLGILVVTPVIVTWSLAANVSKHFRFGRLIESVCFYAAMILCSFSIFHNDLEGLIISVYPFLIFAVISWGALRFNVATISGSALILAIIAVTGEAISEGPLLWGGATPEERLLIVQLFIGVLTSTGLFLSASLTESKNTAKAIKDSEERFRTLIEQAPEAIILFDIDLGKIVAANPAAERLFGCSKDELLKGGPQRFYAESQPDGRAVEDSMAEYNRRVLAGEEVATECSIRTVDGRDLLCELHLVKLPSDSGTLIRGRFLDITERKETEQYLKEKEFFFRESQRAAMVGSYKCDFIKGKWESSEALDIIFGIDQDYSRSIQGWLDLMHPDDRDMMDSYLMEEVISKWKIFNKEYRIIRQNDGEVRWLNGRGSGEVDSDGNLTLLMGTILDITELKEAEAQLLESRRQYQLLVERTPDLITRVDKEGCLVFVNHAALDIYGLPPEDCVGRSAFDFIHPEDREFSVKVFQNWLISGMESFTFENRQVGILGQEHNMSWSIRSEKDENGIVQGFAGTARDITDRKRGEEEKFKLESQLQQAQKMESVGRLAGGIAHDFNNLLTVILGHAHLGIMESDPSHPSHSNFEEISYAAERSADLTKQLLAFARKQAIEPRVLNLNDAISGTLKMLQRLISEGINLNWHPGASLWMVEMDPTQIDQILTNLCVNARDAIGNVGNIIIETGNISIDRNYCLIHPYALEGDYVWLTLSDDGIGMDKETQSHIFEPFFTTKKIGEGTGLGLATIYGIVKQNNGFINVNSEKGQGTTFTIYIPRHIDNTAKKEMKCILTEPPRGVETILLVEDEPAILDLVSMLLKNLGYEVLTASTPNEAIRVAHMYEHNINLLLTDVVMPEMNGRDLAMNLTKFNPRLKLLFMSGHTAEIITSLGVVDKGLYFIQKPFNSPTLAVKVREVLDGVSYNVL